MLESLIRFKRENHQEKNCLVKNIPLQLNPLMDKAKYEKYKLTVKLWEHEFKKTNQRIPSKVRKWFYWSFLVMYIFLAIFIVDFDPLSIFFSVWHQRCADECAASLQNVLSNEDNFSLPNTDWHPRRRWRRYFQPFSSNVTIERVS